MNYGVIDQISSLLLNVIAWDGTTPYETVPGTFLVPVPDGAVPIIGVTRYIAGEFINPDHQPEE